MRELLDCCSDMPRVAFSAGEVLLAQGDTTNRLYVLVSGAIEILRGTAQVAVISEPGSAVGDMSILLASPHTATARALGQVEAHIVADGAAFFQAHPDASYHVARMLAHRLNAATTYLADLKKQFAGTTNHLEMVGDVLESLLYRTRPAALTPGSDREPPASP